MADEIEFETSSDVEKKVTEENAKKFEDLSTKVNSLENKLTQILTTVEGIKTLSETKLLSKKLDGEKKVEELSKENAELKTSVTDTKAQLETMSKKLVELENKPARITQVLSENVDVDAKKNEFLKSITGGEMLVYAEKRDIKWGKGKSE
jgi:hypothetical protein